MRCSDAEKKHNGKNPCFTSNFSVMNFEKSQDEMFS